MRLILTEQVPNLGDIGDIVNVKGGYGRNFLLPRALGALADESNMKEFNHKRKVITKKQEKALAEKRAVAKKIERLKVSVAKQVGEDDRIFGSVTSAEIATHLESAGIAVDRRSISFPEEIKKLGSYKVEVKLHTQVVASLKVSVTKGE